MPLSPQPAVVLVSISTDTASTAGQALRVPVETLANLLASQNLQATWISQAPVDSPYTSTIVATAGQELALSLGGATGRGSSREQCGAELRMQAIRARAANLPLSTVFARDQEVAQHAELLVKYGVTALCPLGSMPATRVATSGLVRASRWLLSMEAHAAARPQKLRWGLWQMPAPVDVASEGQWRVRRAIDRAVASGALVHLHVDLSALATGGGRMLDPVESILRQVASYAQSGRLRSETMASVAQRLSRPRTVVPAASILRRRAA